MRVHFQKTEQNRAQVGGMGKGSLCSALSTTDMEAFFRGEQNSFRGLDRSQEPRSALKKNPENCLPSKFGGPSVSIVLISLYGISQGGGISWHSCSKAEIIRPVIPSKQLAATVTTRAQEKHSPKVPDDLLIALKAELKGEQVIQGPLSRLYCM